jgi:Bestrophin, RFP-TM, chloride channel
MQLGPHALLLWSITRRWQLEEEVGKLVDYLGMCERILTTPVPRSYSRHTSRFLTVYLFTLPLVLVSVTHQRWCSHSEHLRLTTCADEHASTASARGTCQHSAPHTCFVCALRHQRTSRVGSLSSSCTMHVVCKLDMRARCHTGAPHTVLHSTGGGPHLLGSALHRRHRLLHRTGGRDCAHA